MAKTYRLNDPTEGDASQAESESPTKPPGRLASLDAYRGFIMITLAASGFGIARLADLQSDAPAWDALPLEATAEANYDTWQTIAFHFKHPDWRSNFLPAYLSDPETPAVDRAEFLKVLVSFWDLIQPAFMFMVGVAMPFSYAKRTVVGQTTSRRFVHALWRALVLVLLGVFLASNNGFTKWEFPNVLCQIGLGYFFVYLLLGRKLWIQLTALAIILGGSWYFFYQYQVPDDYDFAAVNATAKQGEVFTGQNSPEHFVAWSKNGNAAHDFDRRFLNLLRNPDDEALSAAGIERDAESWAPQPVVDIFFSNPEPFLFTAAGIRL